MEDRVTRIGRGARALVQAPGRAFARVTTTSVALFSRGRSSILVMYARTAIDYRNEVGDPMQSSIIAAIVGWIARNFPDAPVRIVRRDGADNVVFTFPKSIAGPGALLKLLEVPNRWYSGIVLWMATVVDFVVHGNAYWLKVRSGGRVVGLYWVPFQQMRPSWPDDDDRVFISHYTWTVNGVDYRVEVDNVVHFRNGLDPNNVRLGVSRLGSLYRELFTDNEAAAFSATIVKNLGVPGLIVSPANTTGPFAMLRGDPQDIKTEIMARTQGDKRGEPMVFTTPTDVKMISWSPEQMDLKSLRRVPEERASAVTGVPAGVAQLGAGLDRNTFTNYAEANGAAYSQGLIPLHRLMAADIEVQLLPDFIDTERNPDVDVFFDASVTEAMRAALTEKWTRHLQAFRAGAITRAQFKRAVGIEPEANGDDDVYVLPNNYTPTPVGDSANPPEPQPRQTIPFPGQPQDGQQQEGAAATR